MRNKKESITIINKIGDIKIYNPYTYKKLLNVFSGKKPTNKTILLFRLYAEKQISSKELSVLKENEYSSQKKGSDLIYKKENNNLNYSNFKKINRYRRRSTLLNKFN